MKVSDEFYKIERSRKELTAKKKWLKKIEPLLEGIEYRHLIQGKRSTQLIMEIVNRDDVADLIRRLPPLPLYRVKDGCLGFEPYCLINPRTLERAEQETAEVTLVEPVTWDFWHDEASYRWYCGLPGLLLNVKVHIKADFARVSPEYVSTAAGRRKTGRWLEYGFVTGSVDRFSGGGNEFCGHRTVYHDHMPEDCYPTEPEDIALVAQDCAFPQREAV